MKALLLCFLALHLWGVTEGAVHKYNGRFFQMGDAWLFRGGREGLYASTRAAVAHWSTVGKGIANGKSYVRFDQLKVSRPAEEASIYKANDGQTGLVQALLFDVRDRNRVGYVSSGRGRHFCCSPELVGRTGCTVGKLIVSPTSGDNEWPKVVDIPFSGNSTVANPTTVEIPITKNGMYYLWFVICDKTLSDVVVSGSTVWKNPVGYLPGMMVPFLKFFGLMSTVYLLLGLIWFLQFARFWRETFQLQNWITVLLLLSMFEMALWYFDFVNFNASGFRPYGITLWAVIISTLRKSISRVLVLLVSMGFGVVRPTLGGLSRKVMFLGGSYLLACLSLDILQNVGAINDLSSSERVLLVMPVAVLDAIFILWIFTSLSKTVAQLQVKRNANKLELYSRFTNALAGGVLASVAWIAFEMYSKLSDQFNESWENDWVNSAFWHVLTFVLFAVICILWAPSQSATRYAYEEGADDEEEIALTSAPKKSSGEEKPVNTDVFSLDDDVEEGKLE